MLTNSLAALAQALGLAYAAGLNLYATVAVIGTAERFGWIMPLPGPLAALASPWIIGLAIALYIIDFLATLIPGVASAWETFHTLIRPPAAAALAATAVWQANPAFVLAAALLGGTLAVATHTTKLGVRYAIDSSPEPLTNGAANVAEFGVVATLAIAIWQHPWISLTLAIALLIALMLTIRLIWRTLRRVVSGHWMPSRGLLQDPRCDPEPHHVAPEDL